MNSNPAYFFSCKYLFGISFTILAVFVLIIIFTTYNPTSIETSINKLCDSSPEIISVMEDSETVKKFRKNYSKYEIILIEPIIIKLLDPPLGDYKYIVRDGNARLTLEKTIYMCSGDDHYSRLICEQKGQKIYDTRNDIEILKHLDSYDCIGR